jgi:hypothetical protein
MHYKFDTLDLFFGRPDDDDSMMTNIHLSSGTYLLGQLSQDSD